MVNAAKRILRLRGTYACRVIARSWMALLEAPFSLTPPFMPPCPRRCALSSDKCRYVRTCTHHATCICETRSYNPDSQTRVCTCLLSRQPEPWWAAWWADCPPAEGCLAPPRAVQRQPLNHVTRLHVGSSWHHVFLHFRFMTAAGFRAPACGARITST